MARSISVALVLDDSQFRRSLSNSSRSVDGLGGSIDGIAGKLAGIAAAAAGAFTFKGIVETTARFEDMKTALTSVTGSVQDGKAAFDFIQNFATQTQFGVEELTQAYIKLKASGIEPTKDLLTTFTDTAAVTTDQLGSLQAMTDLLSRTTSGGLGLEELNRLADRGIPVFKILEEQMGLTRLEISEFGKDADGARIITDALLAGLNQEFGGATQDRLENLSTALSNMSIAGDQAMNTIGEGLAPALNDAVTAFTDFILSNEDALRAMGELIGEGITLLMENLDTVTNAVIAFGAAWAAMKIGGLITSIQAMGGAMRALNVVMASNPIGMVATAVGLLVLGFLELKDRVGGVGNAFKTIANVGVATVNMIINAFAAAGEFITTLFSNIGSAIWDVITGELDADKLGEALGDALSNAGEQAKAKFTEDGFFEQPFTIVPIGQEETQEAIVATQETATAAHETEREQHEEKRNFHEERIQHEKELEEEKDKNDKREQARHERAVERAEMMMSKSILQMEQDLAHYDLQGERIGLTNVEIEQLEATNKLNDEREKKLLEIAGYNLTDAEKNELQAQLNALYDDQIVKINEKIAKTDEEQRKFSTGWANAWAKFKDDATNSAKAAEKVMGIATGAMDKGFNEFIETGKVNFRGLVKDMLKEIAKVLAKQLFFKALDFLFPGLGSAGSLFDGLFDQGGFIKSGHWGIVGEKGPEIVTGPARVVGREDTAKLFGGSSSGPVTININAVDALSFKQLVARDPEFMYNVAMAGAKRVPGATRGM